MRSGPCRNRTMGGTDLGGKHDRKNDPDDASTPSVLRTGPIVVRGIGRGLRDTIRSDAARRRLPDPVEEAPSGDSSPSTDVLSDLHRPAAAGPGPGRDPRRPRWSSARLRGALPWAGWSPSLTGSTAAAAAGIVLVLVLVLLSVLLVGAVVAQNHSTAARAAEEAGRYTAPPLPTVVPIRARVALIGDETAAATGPGARPVRRWSSIVGDDLGISFSTLAVDGGGYVTKGAGKRTFLSQVQAVPSDIDAVVLFGGVHDGGRSLLTVARATTKTISEVHARAPKARIIVVGPVEAGAAPVFEIDQLRGALRSSAALGKARWVDPIAADWVPVDLSTASDGRSAQAVAADERRIAEKMSPLLEPLTKQ